MAVKQEFHSCTSSQHWVTVLTQATQLTYLYLYMV